MFYNVTK